jgi:hypothetical protein
MNGFSSTKRASLWPNPLQTIPKTIQSVAYNRKSNESNRKSVQDVHKPTIAGMIGGERQTCDFPLGCLHFLRLHP